MYTETDIKKTAVDAHLSLSLSLFYLVLTFVFYVNSHENVFTALIRSLDWDRFQARYRLPWTLDGQMIVVRRRARMSARCKDPRSLRVCGQRDQATDDR